MSADSTEREVFEEIDPDPDAILAEFGVESPDDLLEADAGAHDAIPDEKLDVDDTTADELFADLGALETADEPEPSDDASEPSDAEARGDDLPFEFVGDSDAIVRDDGDVIDATASELTALTATGPSADGETDADSGDDAADPVRSSDDGDDVDSERSLTVRTDDANGLSLVGPDPDSRRVPNERFGDAAFDTR